MGYVHSLFCLFLFAGCGHAPLLKQPLSNTPPTTAPPSPTSVTQEEPGGDASNPQIAALARLASESWGTRNDTKDAVLVPLPDAEHWRRVRYWTIPTYTGFRFGDAHHGMAALFIRDAPSPNATSDECMHDFEMWGRGIAQGLGAELTEAERIKVVWRSLHIPVRTRELSVLWGFDKKTYAAAYGAYPAWPGACVVLAYAFPMNQNTALAKQVRDRFAHEAFALFGIQTPTRPEP